MDIVNEVAFSCFAKDVLLCNSAAQIVKSVDEVENMKDEYGMNQFEIFQLLLDDKDFAILRYSLYIKEDFSEIYLRLDDIPAYNLRLGDKEIPKSIGTIRINHFTEDLENYCDNVLTPLFVEYYKDSNHEVKINYIADSRAFSPLEFLGFQTCKSIKIIFDYTDYRNIIYPIVKPSNVIQFDDASGLVSDSENETDNRQLKELKSKTVMSTDLYYSQTPFENTIYSVMVNGNRVYMVRNMNIFERFTNYIANDMMDSDKSFWFLGERRRRFAA